MNETEKKIYEYLATFNTENRRTLIETISAQRTRYVTVVTENLSHAHNISAVLRTCECFGIQDVHIIKNGGTYNTNPKIVRGSDKWLNLYQYTDKEQTSSNVLTNLKQSGYRIVATTPHEKDTTIHNFDLTKGPAAFVFGTEQSGISQEVMEIADEFIQIPMQGFTESLNISVTAGILIHYITSKLRDSEINWQLTQYEIDKLRLEWMRLSLKRPDLLEKHFLTQN